MSKRVFLGIELGGPRKTALVALDCFADQKKAFVQKVISAPESAGEETPDETLLRLVRGLAPEAIGINAPLSLPPCVTCELPVCPGVRNCSVESVSWMREEAQRLKWKQDPNPYTQRPVDLLLRGNWQKDFSFAVDDSFGSNRGPRAARMRFLCRHLKEPLLEVLPRLALAGIARWYGIPARELRLARDLEVGVENRTTVLQLLGKPKVPGAPSLFLYEEDILTFAADLPAFDALLCALMVFFQELGLLESIAWESSWGKVGKPLPRPEGPRP
jgi:hypothetical protein